jgi:phage shock protein PspC (stress-responsive transcriptional regulator)
MLNPDRLRGTFGQRPWIAGICAAIAAEFDLPVMVVRCIALMFAVLPTGLTYLLLALLSGRHRGAVAAAWESMGGGPSSPPPAAFSRDYGSMRQRFAALESRLASIEAFVSSKDFELYKGFSQMGD